MQGDTSSNNSRMVLMLIAGIPVVVILISTWLWYFVARGELDLVSILGTSNQGTLLKPPRQLEGIDLQRDGALPFQFSSLDAKWTFVIPGGSRCDAQCEKTLYTTRQIHIAMGKEFPRIARMYIGDTAPSLTQLDVEALSDNTDVPDDFAQFLHDDHQGLTAVSIDQSDFDALFPEFIAAADSWYLIDPAGWIMMAYDSQVDYKGVISDLKFLLKNSSE